MNFLTSFFAKLFSRVPAESPNVNEKFVTSNFYDSMLTVWNALPNDHRREVDLGIPEWSGQGNYPQCVGEAVAGAINVMKRLYPERMAHIQERDPRDIYLNATAIDGQPDKGGTWLRKGMDVIGMPWVRVKVHPDVLFAIMRVMKRPIVIVYDMHRTDLQTGASGRVMIPSHGAYGPHAVVLYGVKKNVEYKLYPWSKKSVADCALLRNTNSPWDREPWLFPRFRMAPERGLTEACIFLFPEEII